MKLFVLLVDFFILELFFLVVLVRVDVFGEVIKRVKRFNNIFICDFEWES